MRGQRGEGDKDYRTPANRQELGDPLRYLFDLSGKRLNPPEFDMDTFKGVFDMGAGGFARYEIQYAQQSVAVPLVTIGTMTIVSPSTSLVTSILNRKQRSKNDISGDLIGPIIDWETRMQTLEITLTFDAAGAIAFNGKYVDVYLFIDPIVGVLGTVANILYLKKAFFVSTGTLSYKMNLMHGWANNNTFDQGSMVPSPWSGWVPARQRLTAQVVSTDGVSQFGANTSVSFVAMATLVPMGVELPK